MQVSSYTFKSPYPNQVQIGRPDASSTQNEKTQEDTAKLTQESNQNVKDAQLFNATQTKEVQAEVAPERMLDVYA